MKRAQEEIQMKGLIFACPGCKKPFSYEKDPRSLRCRLCQISFALTPYGFSDFRLLALEDSKPKGWDIEEIEKAYREMGDYEDNFAWAAKDGIPREVEAYRHKRLKGRVLEWLQGKTFEKILVVGCGSGYFLYQIDEALKIPAKVLAGLEVSAEQLLKFRARISKNKNQTGLPVLAGAEHLPLEENQFDLVVSSEVMEHILRPDLGAREVFRVLKPGGIFCLTTPSFVPTEFWKAVFFIPRVLRRILQGRSIQGMNRLHVYDRPLSERRLQQILRKSGFEILRLERNIFLPHESFFPLFPSWLSHFFLKSGGFLESYAPFLGPLLGLHFVVECRKPLTE